MSTRFRPKTQVYPLVLASSFVVFSAGACDRRSEPDSQGCLDGTHCRLGTSCVDGFCLPPAAAAGAAGMTSVAGSLNNAGASALAGAGGSAVAGAPSTSGGSSALGGSGPSAGAGGTASGGAVAGGGAAGTPMAGEGAMGGTPRASSSEEVIDDLEDDDDRIREANGRQGPWHIFNNQGNGGNQQPSFSDFVPEKGGANGTSYAVHTTGDGYEFAGVGFDLNNPDATPESERSAAFDASAFQGVAFWAKGSGDLRLEIPTRNFVPEDRGGTCTSSCWNVYGDDLDELTGEWREYRVPFSALQRESGGTEPAFAQDQLMSISFKHRGSARFDFWVDEIRFYGGQD